MATFGNNPWLQKQGEALTAQSNQNLNQNVMPGIGQGAQQAGMYGSSRQGTAQGIAAGNAQTGLNSALANMYSTAYGQDQAYDMQGQQLASQNSIAAAQNATANQALQNSLFLGDQQNRIGLQNSNNSYNLGLGQNANQATANANSYSLGQGTLANNQAQTANSYNLGLGNLALNNNQNNNSFYTQNRQLDQSGAQLGANLFSQGNQGNLGIGSGQYNLGNQSQNAPMTALGQYSNVVNPYSGLGGAQTVTANTGGGMQGLLGGALAGAQLYNNVR